MKMIVLGDRYFLLSEDRKIEISKAQAWEYYEEGLITSEEVLSYEYD